MAAPSATDPKALKRRERKAIAVVLTLSLIALLWGLKVYFHPYYHLQQLAQQVADLEAEGELKDGDIIFQTSRSAQSQAIQSATHSKYSHCGLVFRSDTGQREWLVLEAVQPVKWTPLQSWIARGKGEHFVIKRCSTDPPLTGPVLRSIRKAGEACIGKDYDLYFGWGDDRIYCSELVWKAYHTATGLDIGVLQHLRDFDLTNPVVAQQLRSRYGDTLPLDEVVISPESIFNSPHLTTVAKR